MSRGELLSPFSEPPKPQIRSRGPPSKSVGNMDERVPVRVKRACDTCRRRKIRCNGETPTCSNCTISRILCQYAETPKKRGPKFRSQGQRPIPASDVAPTPPGPPGPATSADTQQASTQSPNVSQHSQQGDISTPFTPSVNISSPDTSLDGGNPSAINFAACQHVHQELTRSVKRLMPSAVLSEIALRCIDMYMQWMYPIMPIIDEIVVRQVVDILDEDWVTWVTTNSTIAGLRSFTHLTALCAVVCSRVPPAPFPEAAPLMGPFLRASRSMLQMYRDLDVEKPDSTSLIIRNWHSNVLHYLGKTSVAMHVMGECLRLMQWMRLHDEAAYTGVERAEERIRRQIFWLMHSSDKSAAMLNNTPIVIHESSLGEEISVNLDSSPDRPLLDFSLYHNHGPYESQLEAGFCLAVRLWSTAADLVTNMAMFSGLRSKGLIGDAGEALAGTLIVEPYLSFSSTLDNLPVWLRDPPTITAASDQAQEYHRRAFSIQRANLLVTFHFLRLYLLQKAAKKGLCAHFGLSNDDTMLAIRKTDIVSDLLNVAVGTPFEALQANGEPCVEKLRQAAVCLLEILDKRPTESLVARSKDLFSTLLDVLASLNSRVTDELSLDYNNVRSV